MPPAPPRLLIVDDEAAHMKALCETLECEAYATTGFTSANEALAALRSQKFDLLLTDLMMCEMDGISLLRTAQEIDGSLVSIVMTGHGAIETAVEAMKGGALDYILKPFKLREILPVLSRALAVRGLRIDNQELQQRVRDRTAEAEATNKELEAFSYSVSHDLCTPLRHIRAYGELLQDRIRDTPDDKTQHYLKTMIETAAHMQQLIDHLLAFSHLGRAELNRTTVNLERLVEETIQGLEMETLGREIVWKKGPLPLVQGDPFLLKQVLVNLLSNAVKYTRPRHPAHIEIGCAHETAEEVVVFVRDNGVGFESSSVDRLFGVFQRLHLAEEFEGIGIGLANVQRIITRHGGRVRAEGAVNEGALFSFSVSKAQP